MKLWYNFLRPTLVFFAPWLLIGAGAMVFYQSPADKIRKAQVYTIAERDSIDAANEVEYEPEQVIR